ncbi:MAG: hypothetical protein JXR37_11110 [Kiritimatiellae bacterium]|nr:hypothetical protein [Kiritimatiellia bacterium]
MYLRDEYRPETLTPENQESRCGLRFYLPNPGRWTRRDAIGQEASINLYGFLENAAIGKLDWLGLYSFSCEEAGGRMKNGDGCCPNGREINPNKNCCSEVRLACRMKRFRLVPLAAAEDTYKVALDHEFHRIEDCRNVKSQWWICTWQRKEVPARGGVFERKAA